MSVRCTSTPRSATRSIRRVTCRSPSAQLLAGERQVELDDVVEAVDELRLEAGLHAGSAARDVRGHDQHRVLEVDVRPSPSSGALVEHLVEDVLHARVGLLHFVEQHDAVRPSAHGLR